MLDLVGKGWNCEGFVLLLGRLDVLYRCSYQKASFSDIAVAAGVGKGEKL